MCPWEEPFPEEKINLFALDELFVVLCWILACRFICSSILLTRIRKQTEQWDIPGTDYWEMSGISRRNGIDHRYLKLWLVISGISDWYLNKNILRISFLSWDSKNYPWDRFEEKSYPGDIFQVCCPGIRKDISAGDTPYGPCLAMRDRKSVV